jgi:hypothetical protein
MFPDCVMARGNARMCIYIDDRDYREWVYPLKKKAPPSPKGYGEANRTSDAS